METWAIRHIDTAFGTTHKYASFGGCIDRTLRTMKVARDPSSIVATAAATAAATSTTGASTTVVGASLSEPLRQHFLYQMVQGTGAAGQLCDTIRKLYAHKNVQYKMTLRLMKSESVTCQAAERACFASAIKATGLTANAMSLASYCHDDGTVFRTATHAPVVLAWKVAADVRQRLVKHRLHTPLSTAPPAKTPNRRECFLVVAVYGTH